MEDYAYEQFQAFHSYFMNQAVLAQGDGHSLPPQMLQNEQSSNRFMNESRRMEAEEIMNQTA